jgi:hypothetical protein
MKDKYNIITVIIIILLFPVIALLYALYRVEKAHQRRLKVKVDTCEICKPDCRYHNHKNAWFIAYCIKKQEGKKDDEK